MKFNQFYFDVKTMKFIISCIVMCCISNVNSFKFESKDYENNMLKYGNKSVYLIHSYGLSINNTLTNSQRSLFLIEPEPVEKFMFISESNLRKNNAVHFSVPFYARMKRVEMKSDYVSRCGRYLKGINLILLYSTIFKTIYFFMDLVFRMETG